MRLIRFGPPGREKPGLWREEGIVDLRAVYPEMPDIAEEFFEEGWLEKAAGAQADGAPVIPHGERLGPPVVRSSKIICLGLNYWDHSREGGFEPPARPLLFSKAPSAVTGPQDPIVLPESSGQVDWEVELAVVVGRRCKRVDAGRALGFVAGYTVLNDVSAREAQFSDGQWFRGKSFDTFAPLGPVVVTADELGDPQALSLTSVVDGVTMQSGTTADMIFKVAEIIAFVSRDITLLPGDLIATGTPAGVGIFRDPPITLAAGNVVECRIEGIGALRNLVVAG